MNTGRKERLEARLASRTAFPAPPAAKRHVSPWPLYAAVAGSAFAISTPTPDIHASLPSISAIHRLSGSPDAPLRPAALAMALPNPGPAFEEQAQAAAPAAQGVP